MEIPAATPLQQQQRPAGSQRRPAGSRRGLPRRRPRPERPAKLDENGQEVPRGRPRGGEEEEPTATLERYNHNNADGSFTFGYVGADGSFREETRGVDCITRGKYGYIDPDGVKREYTYTSGLPCEIGEDGNQIDNSEGVNSIDDTIDPRERFRQTENTQLSENEIPEASKRQRTRRPQAQRPAAPQPAAPQPAAPVQQTGFTNFGNNPNSIVPERRPAPQGSALDNLLNIAENGVAAQAARPAIPQRIRPTPRPATPRPTARRPAAPANPGSFDFDQELEGFTLNRPSLTFEQNRAQQTNGASFQSQLVFDQNTGTFQTELKQAGQPNQVNAAAPFQVTTAVPATTIDLTSRVTPAPSTTRFSPRPTTAARPTPTQAPAQPILPAGTIKLDFEPLNIPQVTPTRAPVPTSRIPVPASPTPTTVRLPAPTQPTAPARPASPAPGPSGAPPASTFFVFNPFQQGGAPAPSPVPASNPFATPVNQNAFQIRPQGAIRPGQAPAAPQAPRAPVQQFAPRPQLVQQPIQQFRPAPSNAAPAPPFQAQSAPRPNPPAPIRQAAPVPVRPAPTQARPIPQAAAPVRAQQPQLQFGFQPVQQQQQPQTFRPQQPQQAFRPQQPQQAFRPQQPGRPFTAFTAFSNGTPPQQLAQQQRPAPPQAPRFAPPQGQPQQFAGQQLRPQAFNPSAAQPGQAPSFSVFGTSQLRGA